MNKIITAAILAFGLLTGSVMADESAIYLVRHAEKQADSDPELTEHGRARAVALAKILHSVDLAKVYSTDTRRTRQTAEPTVADKGLSIETYDPRAFRQYADALKQEFLNGDKSILVVGHSNTTPYLATLLTGEEFPMMSEDQYDRLYVVRKSEDGSLKATIETFNP